MNSHSTAPDQHYETVSEAADISDNEAVDNSDEHYSDSASGRTEDCSDGHYWATRVDHNIDSDLFGYLEPCNPLARRFRIDLFKKVPSYMIGSNTDMCDIVLSGPDIEGQHCRILWSGSVFATSEVCVYGLSDSGTWINGQKIGKDETEDLYSGDEICFAPSGGVDDYRYTYYHTADVKSPDGVHADYEIGEVIGMGSYGNVSIAKDRESKVQWVVKRVVTTKKNETTYETEAMKRVGFHPNVCYLREIYYQYDNSINFILEYMKGGSLEVYLDQYGIFSNYLAKHITYQICCGMAHVHSKGIVHRDLKPSNIILTLEYPPIAKVADFGSAMVHQNHPTKELVGTLWYMAPECARCEYTDRVDSWSVGIVVLSMLTDFDHGQRVTLKTREQAKQWLSDLKVPKLDNVYIEMQAKSFILSLLVVDPVERMSLTHTLTHAWLLALTEADQTEQDEVQGMLLG